ncbi:MAG: hypothetical protein ACYC4L_01560 [Chloroflexota bacterium]
MTRRLSMRWLCLRPPEQLKPEEQACSTGSQPRTPTWPQGTTYCSAFASC